jgi:predicted anti-sigma-YlaC factor YlaD
MNELNCEYVRDVYPDVLNGHVDDATGDAVRAHMASCAECRSEADAVAAIFAGALVAPPELYARVLAEHRAVQPARQRFGMRYVAMAATVAAAVIGGSILFRTQDGAAPPVMVTEADAPIGAVSVETALVSGKGSLQDLTIEELERLLGEIES